MKIKSPHLRFFLALNKEYNRRGGSKTKMVYFKHIRDMYGDFDDKGHVFDFLRDLKYMICRLLKTPECTKNDLRNFARKHGIPITRSLKELFPKIVEIYPDWKDDWLH